MFRKTRGGSLHREGPLPDCNASMKTRAHYKTLYELPTSKHNSLTSMGVNGEDESSGQATEADSKPSPASTSPSRHRILSGPSGKKPAPTSEAEHWEQSSASSWLVKGSSANERSQRKQRKQCS
ncbi:hypothetical protein EYF80_000369 [Liparis tanakae]|uniref:Uncharacterized protein n=1 Tax=Liparis tanakae TaxID=230148 RepID=A0A4Z2JGI3_9TELE|nr:hypothetical protein EYF80_000369 [Liparis tanakae]